MHFAEVYPDNDKAQLAPRLDVYAAIEAAGMLVVVTLRDGGSMVGYFVGIMSRSLHCAGLLECTQNMLFVHPLARGRFGGVRLMRAARREAQRLGVHRWHASSMAGHDASRLFRAVGMQPTELYHSEWIGAAA